MRIKFKINNLEEERRVIARTKKNIAWFKNRGYFFTLPDNRLEEEYSGEKYKISAVIKEWRKTEKIFLKGIKIFNRDIKKTIKVSFTRYGVGGSYFPPDKILININEKYKKSPKEISMTMAHEIIHLFIEPIVRRLKIDHWIKERVVDLILNDIISGLKTAQNLPLETKKIDKAFEDFFPDIEKIFRNAR
ncbi:MAG: hypothetical protein UW11_C0019G0014 [Parcubacteria group bacterium GW2011_GWA2_43_9b]|nr:MAG: hypothetical protein UW11_C0019G0014 [Parcubacteria group bacterium GW2011_GWA2_43_9b]